MFNTGPVGSIATYTAGLRGRSTYDVNTWGGGRARRMLHCAYTLSFLCLLRFDEVLKIRFQDIEFISPDCVKLTLPFRKTSPCGGAYIVSHKVFVPSPSFCITNYSLFLCRWNQAVLALHIQ